VFDGDGDAGGGGEFFGDFGDAAVAFVAVDPEEEGVFLPGPSGETKEKQGEEDGESGTPMGFKTFFPGNNPR
jgi:hypothetical protein